MSDILIAFASRHGHTAKIADRIAAVLRDAGHRVRVVDDVAAVDPSPYDFDAVIGGASIHNGEHQAEVVAWARRHSIALTMVPSAFFSVCLAIADGTDESRAAAQDYLDDFEERTGWTPRARTTIAGALQYREYDFLTRLIMRALMTRGGHPTDTARDYEYTDWRAVDAFARRCASLPTPSRLPA
jgi:menaquinone-dependent protoporphyrinogen oxidase